jgi:hypothetical protein
LKRYVGCHILLPLENFHLNPVGGTQPFCLGDIYKVLPRNSVLHIPVQTKHGNPISEDSLVPFIAWFQEFSFSFQAGHLLPSLPITANLLALAPNLTFLGPAHLIHPTATFFSNIFPQFLFPALKSFL